MKRFNVTVTRTVEYEVEVDETVYNEDARKEWEGKFWKLDGDEPAEAFARGLAEQSARFIVNDYIYGFSIVGKDRNQADRLKNIYQNDINYNMFIRELDDYTKSECEECEVFVDFSQED